jgi:hypothetical protein
MARPIPREDAEETPRANGGLTNANHLKRRRKAPWLLEFSFDGKKYYSINERNVVPYRLMIRCARNLNALLRATPKPSKDIIAKLRRA